MGFGDQLIGTGLARGAHERGRRVAFGDGRRIIWDGRSKELFAGNPNIAPPGSEGRRDLQWVTFYKGARGYNSNGGNHWVWNMKWRCTPGEVFFTEAERAEGAAHGSGFVVVEPNIESWKLGIAPNKDWGREKFTEVVRLLRADGHDLVQFVYDKSGPVLPGVRTVRTRGFRHALAVMSHATLYLGLEGGLHHGAAALSLPGVVIFGDWVPPQVTGYLTHTNLTGRSGRYCGMYGPCRHCREAMESISIESVYEAARRHLGAGATAEAGGGLARHPAGWADGPPAADGGV